MFLRTSISFVVDAGAVAATAATAGGTAPLVVHEDGNEELHIDALVASRVESTAEEIFDAIYRQAMVKAVKCSVEIAA